MRIASIGLLASFLALPGCASAPAPQAGVAAQNANTTAAKAAVNAAAIRERLTGTNNGLEVRRWAIRDQGDSALAALIRHADGVAADEHTLARLKRNGFRLVRVPVEHMDALSLDMGGAAYDANEWHGQVHTWRSLLAQPVSEAGRAVAIDGQVLRFDRGEFQLMIRCWTVQMEDGPYLHLEVLPRRRVPQVGDLRRLLGDEDETAASQAFGSMALDLQLQAGYAYLLLGESPQIDWPGLDAPPAANDEPQTAATAEPRPSRTGPIDMIGPEATAPRTLGEMLLLPDPPANRIVLGFVPKIPSELFVPGSIPDHASNSSAQGGG